MDWELETPNVGWDKGANCYILHFLARNIPLIHDFRNRSKMIQKRKKNDNTAESRIVLPEKYMNELLRELEYAGYGYLHRDDVLKKVEEMIDSWSGPPEIIKSFTVSSDKCVMRRKEEVQEKKKRSTLLIDID